MARTRNKVSLALISNDSARRSTFNSRKKGLLKKVRELATLCGVMVCAIIYGPTDPKPETWPSPADTALALVWYNSAPEETKKHRKMMMMINLQEFLQQGNRKLQDRLQRQEYKTHQIEMDCLLYDGVQQGNIWPEHCRQEDGDKPCVDGGCEDEQTPTKDRGGACKENAPGDRFPNPKP